jgi:hypothetical protein
MAGRQIRWPGVGRVAVIGAAVIAAIAALPALMGSDRPPPVPADVGLLPPPSASAPPPAPLAPEVPSQPRSPAHQIRRQKGDSANGKRPRHLDRGRRRKGTDSQEDEADSDVSPTPSPVYVPSYAPPPPIREFRIEP